MLVAEPALSRQLEGTSVVSASRVTRVPVAIISSALFWWKVQVPELAQCAAILLVGGLLQPSTLLCLQYSLHLLAVAVITYSC